MRAHLLGGGGGGLGLGSSLVEPLGRRALALALARVKLDRPFVVRIVVQTDGGLERNCSGSGSGFGRDGGWGRGGGGRGGGSRSGGGSGGGERRPAYGQRRWLAHRFTGLHVGALRRLEPLRLGDPGSGVQHTDALVQGPVVP